MIDSIGSGHIVDMLESLDPRAWNIGTQGLLAVGLALVAGGCALKTVSLSDDETEEEADSEGEGEGPDTGEPDLPTGAEDPDGCVTEADCPPGYECFDSVCEYIPAPDGGPWYECYVDQDCGPLGLCVDYGCEQLTSPPTCDPPAPTLIPVPLADAALALSFADLDGDGAEELVVATETQLHVFESGAVVSTISARGIESDEIRDMAAGQLDAAPGDDLTILVGDDLRVTHSSDGVDGFGPAVVAPLSLLTARGQIVGDFDGAAPEDLLIWGDDGASLTAGGPPDLVSAEPISGAIYRPPASDAPGFGLRESTQLAFFDLDGGSDGTLPLDSSAPAGSFVTLLMFGEPIDISGQLIGDSWTLLSNFRFNPPTFAAAWGLPLRVSEMAATDLGGGMHEDIVIIADGELWVYREVGFLPEECLIQVPLDGLMFGAAVEVATGDHDGDGDEEIAVRFEDGEIAIVDDEG